MLTRTFCRLSFLALFALLLGCQVDPPPVPASPALSPTNGSLSGYYRVQIDVAQQSDPSTVTWVKFGSISAYDLSVTSDGFLEVTVQGHPEAGEVAVTFGSKEETFTLEESFTYNPPLVQGLDTMVAMGASLTQGTQRGVPTKLSVTLGPAKMLAEQLGLYFPLSIPIGEGFQEMGPDRMGPPPYCAPPPLNDFQIEQASAVIEELTDPDTGEFHFADLRIDPTLNTHNFAVGGSRVADMLDGPKIGEVAMHFISHMAYDPSGTLFDPVKASQMELIEEMKPELIVSFDLLGNDLIDGMINDSDFSSEDMTPTDVFLADITRAVDRLAATGATVFVATLPSPTNLPFFHAKRARLASEGLTENAPLVFAAIDEGVVAGNARLKEEAALHDNIHVVDIDAQVKQWAASGIQIGAETLYIRQYGGLVGLDGLHFTDTAYALIANLFIEAMEDVFETEIPKIDLVSTWAQDRERPDVLLEAGFDTSQCEDFSSLTE